MVIILPHSLFVLYFLSGWIVLLTLPDVCTSLHVDSVSFQFYEHWPPCIDFLYSFTQIWLAVPLLPPWTNTWTRSVCDWPLLSVHTNENLVLSGRKGSLCFSITNTNLFKWDVFKFLYVLNTVHLRVKSSVFCCHVNHIFSTQWKCQRPWSAMEHSADTTRNKTMATKVLFKSIISKHVCSTASKEFCYLSGFG